MRITRSVIAALALALVAVVGVPAATASSERLPRYAPPLGSAIERLAEASRPFNVAIFGDSTGISRYGWQVIVPEWLGKTYNRIVTLHPWSITPPIGYEPTWGLNNAGKNTVPITIWNASAAGADVAYAENHLSTMVPVTPSTIDLIVVNFGHVEKPNRAVPDISRFLGVLTARFRNAAIIVTEQNPDVPGYLLTPQQNTIVHRIAAYAKKEHLSVVDVYDAFERNGSVRRLLNIESKVHPDEAGYEIWGAALQKLLEAGGVPSTVPLPAN
jgi:hypothetical protein